MCDLTNPAFTDEDKARELLEASRWPDGPSDNSSSVRQGPGFDFPQGRFVSTGRVISDKNDAYGPESIWAIPIRGHLKEGFLARFLAAKATSRQFAKDCREGG